MSEHGMQLTTDFRFFFTVISLSVSATIAGIAFRRLYSVFSITRAEPISGTIGDRIRVFTKNVLFQKKLFKDFWPGLQHAIIFWGFILITIGTTEHILE